MRPRLVGEAVRLLRNADDAEDTVQEAVLKLWAMRSDIGTYRSPDALAVTIVRRLSQNRLRRQPTDNVPEVADTATPETLFITREEGERLMRMLDRLPDAQQAVLRMKHMDGLEVAEIARITGSSTEAVRQNLSRARRRILEIFKI